MRCGVLTKQMAINSPLSMPSLLSATSNAGVSSPKSSSTRAQKYTLTLDLLYNYFNSHKHANKIFSQNDPYLLDSLPAGKKLCSDHHHSLIMWLEIQNPSRLETIPSVLPHCITFLHNKNN